MINHEFAYIIRNGKRMELQPPQELKSPLVTIVSEKPEEKKYNQILLNISKTINDADEKKLQSNKELKELLSTLNAKLDDASNPLLINITGLKNIEELKNITGQQSSSIKKLQEQNQELAEKIQKLSQFSDSLTTFMSYCAILSLAAFTIGSLLAPAKIMAMCNHVINQHIYKA